MPSPSRGWHSPGADDDVEFAFGLDLILDGLEGQRLAARRTRTSS